MEYVNLDQIRNHHDYSLVDKDDWNVIIIWNWHKESKHSDQPQHILNSNDIGRRFHEWVEFAATQSNNQNERNRFKLMITKEYRVERV